MLKKLFIVSMLFLCVISGVSFGQQHNFVNNDITYIWENEPNLIQSKKVFVDAFVKCYEQIPLDILRMSTREEMVNWIDEVFETLYTDYKNSKYQLWISAKAKDKIVGFLIIDIAKYPEEIYLAQLAVTPEYQGRGIASSMIRSLFDQFSECSKFVVITRHANEEAKALYNALGFTASSYMHEGYSAELFTGFEYIKYQ